MVAVELEPLIQQKKPLSAVLAVVIVLVVLIPSIILTMVLYVWVSGFTGMGEGVMVEGTEKLPQMLAMDSWSKTTGTTASATVVATSPNSGIEWSDITWHLYNVSAASVDTGAFFMHTDVDNDGYLEAGDTVKVIASTSGTYRVRAIVNGSMIYQSASFTI